MVAGQHRTVDEYFDQTTFENVCARLALLEQTKR